MGEVWEAMRLNHDDESVVVVPSITLDRAVAASGTLTQAMEERFLFLLVLLRQPRLRMVYVTSMPIAPEIVEYYLALLPGVIPSHARSRLSLVSVNDASPRSLSEKLLDRPRVLARIGALIPNRARSHLVPYNTTELERDVALSLGIPMYGADPRLAELGSKTGCRRLFGELGVPYPLGAEDLHGLDDIADAIVEMRAAASVHAQRDRQAQRGCLGSRATPSCGSRASRHRGRPTSGTAVLRRLAEMELESETTPFDVYVAKFAEGGGIVEERIEGDELLSPSVQLRVLPGGEVELLSTHDQLLGGASGQKYLGCVFPADPEYAQLITTHAATIGARLAELGALGRFAVDFVVVREGTGWTPYAIELNLRKGGTTHPFLTLQFLTDGRYDPATALFLTPSGEEKHLVATDHLESDLLRGLVPLDLFDIVARHGIHFDQSRQVGIVFHMISSLTEHGRVGLTAVGDTAEDAETQVPGRAAHPARGGQIRVRASRPSRADARWT